MYALKMKLITCFLSIISLSIVIMIAETNAIPDWDNIEQIFEDGESAMTYLPNSLRPLDEGLLYKNAIVIVWRGIYNAAMNVAIKIHKERHRYDNELMVFERLNPTNDSDIVEKHRIPKLYQYGPVFDSGYFIIVSSSFVERLLDRMVAHDRAFSDSTILLIFKQVMEALRHLHSNNVQCKIYPENIFIRGHNIFLGNFNEAKLDGRRLIDDYEKLLEMVWNMARIPVHKPNSYKLKKIDDPIVRGAFESILNMEPVPGEYGLLPDYDKIITIADDALTGIITESGEPVLFDWLKKTKRFVPGASSSRRHS